MKTNQLLGIILASVAAVGACSPDQHPLVDAQPQAAILDGAHGGNTGFYFLSPMVPEPSPTGTFDPTVSPEVHVCAVDDEGNCGAPLVVFTTQTGPGSETIRVNETDERYLVNWHAGDFELSASTYRVRVFASDQELGFADIAIWQSAGELKNLSTGEVMPLRDGRTLPIAFRIEQGAIRVAPPLAGGARHTCALSPTGLATCAGWNRYGQLGNGSFEESAVPVAVAGELQFQSIAAGAFSTCGVTTEGDAYCWGYNRFAQAGAGYESFAVSEPTLVVGGLDWRSVAPGYLHACGLTVADEVYCWGYNGDGAIGSGTQSYVEVLPQLAGSGYASVASLYRHSCALALTGRPDCWGFNFYGQVGTGAFQPDRVYAPTPVVGGLDLVQLDAGHLHSCGLTEAGSAWCWGYNFYGSLGDGFMVTTPPYGSASPVPVSTLDVFESLSAGSHTCGLTSDGRALCWGFNRYGQLGTGFISSTSPWGVATPQAVLGGHTFQSIEAGQIHTCGVTQAADVLCWGYNAEGALGTGETTPSSPYAIPEPTPSLFGGS